MGVIINNKLLKALGDYNVVVNEIIDNFTEEMNQLYKMDTYDIYGRFFREWEEKLLEKRHAELIDAGFAYMRACTEVH